MANSVKKRTTPVSRPRRSSASAANADVYSAERIPSARSRKTASRSPLAQNRKRPSLSKKQKIQHSNLSEQSGVSITAALSLASLGLMAVYILFKFSPKTTSGECNAVGDFWWFVSGAVSAPKETALTLSKCAKTYEADEPGWTLALYVSLYLTLQAAAIPGPLILSLMSGMLWPLWKAQLVIAFCATTGASLCYLLSRTLRLGQMIVSINKERAAQFQAKVLEAEESGNLLYFMLFLRVSPLLPNWFVNLASPVAGVPLKTFALATLVGLIPANILHYHTGKQLHELVTLHQEGNTARNFVILLSLQFAALIPTIFKGQIQRGLNVK